MKGKGLLHEGELAGASVQHPALSKPHILVVDKDSDLCRLYSEVLTRSGYVVDIAEDGIVGWKALKARNYSLLITEHDVPVFTGVELVGMARAAHMDLPVVMAAERLPAHELVQNPTLRLAALLPKPFYLSELLETVRTALRTVETPSEKIVPLRVRLSRPPAIGSRMTAS